MLDVNEFDKLRIGLATADQIRMWSNGEVKKPETINYRTLKPEKDGLFCEKIFGPTKDWECYCGKYKRVRFKGIICERCGVEVTRSKVRRERMGHIELAAPVAHIWYLKGVPSRLGYLLDMAPKSLEKIIYFAAHVVTTVDFDQRDKDLGDLDKEMATEVAEVEAERDAEIEKRLSELEAAVAELEAKGAKKADTDKLKKATDKEIEELKERADLEIEHLNAVISEFRTLKPKKLIEDERVWRDLVDRYSEYFSGGMGADSVRDLIATLDLDAEEENLREVIATAKGQRKAKAIKRLKVTSAFNGVHEDGRAKNDPQGMVLDAVPVLPPELRPMVQLDGGRFATSDLNDLYRRVINRNNRLKRLLDLGAPEIIVNNEKRMLQEAVDALFDNGRRGRPVTGPGNRALKSLSDMLKGKQGRFRQNLLGKRVDYSGRSVIVVGPQLRLQQCGLPKQMALELFKPFVMKRLVDLEYAQNIKSAKRMVERARPQVWDVLEEVIKEHPVFLNRAPTLHRLGIQAFEPILVEGKAIQIHPLVCAAFNADFDGDQMAVHLPLSAEAQAEARLLMLSAHNILSPAHGRPIAVPSQDMVIGMYYLTEVVPREDNGALRSFSSVAEALMAHEAGGRTSGANSLTLHELIHVRVGDSKFPVDEFPVRDGSEETAESPVLSRDEATGRVLVETTLGRILFNDALPADFPFVSATVKKRDTSAIVAELVDRFDNATVATSLDAMKDLGFRYATKAGLTIGMEDVKSPPSKAEILDKYEKEAEKVERQHAQGVITDQERRQKEIEIWTEATDEVRRAMEEGLRQERFNPIDMMVGSGARGNIMQVRQIAGMRGLVANPKGEIIPRPIKSNFREGLSVLEYFISTHGARKGLADTALRTADSGYLTRRLVDVAQELIVREEDCGTSRGIWVEEINEEGDKARSLETKILGRVLAEGAGGFDAGTYMGQREMNALMLDEKVDRVRVRSVLTCETVYGVCGACYGWQMATNRPAELGEAIGIIAAQSIGEPGTQLTMRTFHTGGVAGEDITHGLPRVVELFEARTPKGKAIPARTSGVVRIDIDEEKDEIHVTVVANDGEEEEYPVSRHAPIAVRSGQEISAGERLVGDENSPLDPKEILEIQGIRETQRYLTEEVQKVYREQGVSIHDKHIEVIVRQMLRRIAVAEPGDAPFLPGEKVDARVYAETNRSLLEESKTPAEGRPELMGITKASLATDSWLAAASFQETTRVLTEAAIEGKSDGLLGLKENVIIGKLIPAGTGMPRYTDFNVLAPDAEPLPFQTAAGTEEEDLAEWLRSIGEQQTENLGASIFGAASVTPAGGDLPPFSTDAPVPEAGAADEISLVDDPLDAEPLNDSETA